MAGHIGKGVEFLVTAREIDIQLRELIRATYDQFHDEHTQPQCGLDLHAFPRQCALFHGLCKKLERLPWREPWAVRTGDHRLRVRITAPLYHLNRLGAEP
jgi:hypothetical protein